MIQDQDYDMTCKCCFEDNVDKVGLCGSCHKRSEITWPSKDMTIQKSIKNEMNSTIPDKLLNIGNKTNNLTQNDILKNEKQEIGSTIPNDSLKNIKIETNDNSLKNKRETFIQLTLDMILDEVGKP
jgi:hypothetical protein